MRFGVTGRRTVIIRVPDVPPMLALTTSLFSRFYRGTLIHIYSTPFAYNALVAFTMSVK